MCILLYNRCHYFCCAFRDDQDIMSFFVLYTSISWCLYCHPGNNKADNNFQFLINVFFLSTFSFTFSFLILLMFLLLLFVRITCFIIISLPFLFSCRIVSHCFRASSGKCSCNVHHIHLLVPVAHAKGLTENRG